MQSRSIPAIRTTHMFQLIVKCELLTGTSSAEGIMASGLCAALTGRTHGCTDQPANVKKTLANSEPSTHGTKRHAVTKGSCPLSGAKPTWPEDGVRSAYDPKRTNAGSKFGSAALSCP